jgi:hypothetical protein
VDCKDCQELVSAAVDNQLSKENLKSFEEHVVEEHVEGCSPCRAEHELESLTKSVIRTRIKMVHTPGALQRRIADQLNQGTLSVDGDKKRWWSNLLSWPILRPTIAFGVAFAAILLILSNPDGSNVIVSSVIPMAVTSLNDLWKITAPW